MTQDTQTVEELARKFCNSFASKLVPSNEAMIATRLLHGLVPELLTTYGNDRFEEGVKAERERIVVWAKGHSKFADAQPVKDDSDVRWEIHYAGYREAIGNLIAHLSDK